MAIREIMLKLDDLDYEAVQRCMAKRQTFRCMPDHDGSNLAGQLLAEICRGWEEMLDMPGRWAREDGEDDEQ